MRVLVRRLAALIGTGAIAGTGLALAAPPANAADAATAQDCLNTLLRARFADPGPFDVVVPPFSNHMTAFFHVRDDSRCDGIIASVAISRPDGSDFRNQNAAISRVEGIVTAYSDFTPGWRDAGTWVVRQIAVKKNGVLAARAFAPATAASVQVRRATTITAWDGLGGPTQRPVISPEGNLIVAGYLKAWGTDGKQHVLAPGQRMVLQVRRAGTNDPYQTVATTVTSASGYYVLTAFYNSTLRKDVRVAYQTTYQTIASHVTYAGVVQP